MARARIQAFERRRVEVRDELASRLVVEATLWPTDRRGAARYDLVFVFDRPAD
jgi:hypothetical protein